MSSSSIGLAVFFQVPVDGPSSLGTMASELGDKFINEYRARLVASTVDILKNAENLDHDVEVSWVVGDPHFFELVKGFESATRPDVTEQVIIKTLTGLQKKHEKAIVLIADAPQIHSKSIQVAIKSLADHDFVIGPTRSGGCYLFGCGKKQNLKKFRKVAFGTESTGKELNDIAESLGAVSYLPAVTSLGQAEDLYTLMEEFQDLDVISIEQHKMFSCISSKLRKLAVATAS